MSQDPRDPETFDEFLDEEQEEGLFEEDLEDEVPEADAAEQRLELLRLRDTPLTGRAAEGVDPADAAEQARAVDPGDDEYR
ncbi:hypothetical protein [Streptomyces johnsoniae]|uniref:Uncharacterized protein n=1 Tax=Streptomyces johnsoniae TaxID=3075532 RepID=A0ABU2S2F9_9ACTN|nr:hypothetical protein [Streptomyces sp. DSM 41886]MDT0443186.1 hypothetical protein [Streptomyces sp. DSM 41886]